MNKKLEILARLLKANQITMEELFILCDKVEQVVPYTPPYQPWNNPWTNPWVGTTGGGTLPFPGTVTYGNGTINTSDFPQSKTLTEYVNSKKN